MIAALYVENGGCYWGLDGVDPWDLLRDARRYDGPHSVVAHPPCQRWGRMATGGPAAPSTRQVGDDDGAFAAALISLARFGGVIEHPEASKAWPWFKLDKPIRHGAWMWTRGPVVDDQYLDGEWYTCYVEQGHYGHMSRKPTWLLTQGIRRDDLPVLNWSKGAQRLHPIALERYGYEKARRIGMAAMVGGKDKTKIRERTPLGFRDVLIAMARSVQFAKVTI